MHGLVDSTLFFNVKLDACKLYSKIYRYMVKLHGFCRVSAEAAVFFIFFPSQVDAVGSDTTKWRLRHSVWHGHPH